MPAKIRHTTQARRLVISFSLLTLNGCMFGSFSNVKNIFSADDVATARRVNAEETNIQITDLRIPEKGERISIVDPLNHQEMNVTFGDTYTAASGKMCNRYNESDEEAKLNSGLACLNKEKMWKKVPLQIDLTDKPD